MFIRATFKWSILVAILTLFVVTSGAAQGVKRVVIIKVDGLPAYYVDRFVKKNDPSTTRSELPWFDEIFYKNGTRIPNFYTRGMSLSGPSWGQIDTGQHLQIKGNVEYDRFTLHAYDYLNFLPYYLGYGMSKKVDMPAVEVLDQLHIPLFCDAFGTDQRYTSQQLYQRGNDWRVIASGGLKLFPGDPNDLIDEWTLGINFRKFTIDQAERDIISKLKKNPEINYFDYYDVSFDHVSHHNNDSASRLVALKELDRVLGRVWEAIRNSDRANETALVLISDHGFSSDDKTYSQGFNLVKLLGSANGGGHHVVTKRRLMLDYSVKGLYPFVPLIKTASSESYYLKGKSSDYPTALVDFDGNERSSIHLRNSDLNILHILFQQLRNEKLSPELKAAAKNAIFEVIKRHRSEWQVTADQLDEELAALHRWVESQNLIVEKLQNAPGADKRSSRELEQNRRVAALRDSADQSEKDYRDYVSTLRNLLALRQDSFDAKKLSIENLIPPRAMGDSNTINELQNYVVGVAPSGLAISAGNTLDLDRSFTRINYFELLHSQKVRNNVQAEVSNRPVDFVAVRVPLAGFTEKPQPENAPNDDPIWLYGGPDKQALLFSRLGDNGEQMYRYVPIADLRQAADGRISFETKEWSDGFPLKYFEDKELGIPADQRLEWLANWHTESEWLNAIHRTTYSNGLIGLNEQMDRHPIMDESSNSPDDKLIRRFRQRQRRLTEADLLVLANNHWNFDVRGFNPGGNHGSVFRVSTNSTFMIAGGSRTGIPRGLSVNRPYDSLSFMPTILRLMGKIDEQNQPILELKAKGFLRFPGRAITELTDPVR